MRYRACQQVMKVLSASNAKKAIRNPKTATNGNLQFQNPELDLCSRWDQYQDAFRTCLRQAREGGNQCESLHAQQAALQATKQAYSRYRPSCFGSFRLMVRKLNLNVFPFSRALKHPRLAMHFAGAIHGGLYVYIEYCHNMLYFWCYSRSLVTEHILTLQCWWWQRLMENLYGPLISMELYVILCTKVLLQHGR